MQKTSVIIGMYCHLPEGVSDSLIEDTYQACYRPFLSTLNRFPEISAVLYFSGCLLKKLETRHPEFFMLLEELIGKRQVELLGGAFYQPILPLIPNTDRLGQIELLTTYLRKSFGRRSRGCWLTEYSWEPWLASTMQTCGIDYTFLLRDQFSKAGIANITGLPMLTEDQGRSVTIFPVFDCLHSSDHLVSLEQAMDELLQKQPDLQLATIMMPGEALKTIWHNSGLESPDVVMERTFAWFRKNALVFDTTTPVRYLKSRKNAGRAYIPGTASKRFIVAIHQPDYNYDTQYGSLRQALNNHHCARNLYSKMSYVHLLIGQLRGDKARKKTAAEDLWTGQSADALWSAPSGGICIPAIRQAAWRGLMDAEQTTRHKAAFKPGIIYADVDFDGEKEFLFQGTDYNAYIQHHDASIFIMDMIKARRNIADMYSDNKNPTVNPAGLFMDYLKPKTNNPTKALPPFHIQNYVHNTNDKTLDSLIFNADLRYSGNSGFSALRISKQYIFTKRKMTVIYTIHNSATEDISCLFAAESKIGIALDEFCSLRIDEKEWANQTEELPRPYLRDFLSMNDTMKILDLIANESALSIRLETKHPAQLMIDTIQTGLDTPPINNQGLSITCTWDISLAAGEAVTRQVDFSIHI